MKATARLIVIALLLAVVLPILPVAAQGGEGDELVTAPELSAAYFMQAESGSFADNGDGTYTLTLEGVGEELVWIATAPDPELRRLNTTSLFSEWVYTNQETYAGDPLFAEAVLEVETLNVTLMLSAQSFEDGMLVAAVKDVTAFSLVETKDDPEVPMAFENASLMITWSAAFQTALFEARAERREEVRDPGDPACVEAKRIWDEYYTWLVNEARPAAKAAREAGDTATLDSILNEMAARNEAATPSMWLYYSDQCQ